MPLYLKLDIDRDGKIVLFARDNQGFSSGDIAKATENTVSQALRKFALLTAHNPEIE